MTVTVQISAMSTPQMIRIRAFGPLQITTRDGAALALGQRRVRKPLELLRALVAAGPAGATREELCESVWELPVKSVYRPLVTTVYRLRRLLGDQQAIVFTARHITLDGKRCWVDAWAFEAALGPQTQYGPETLTALTLYRGALFEGQFAPYLSAMRERCCQQFVAASLQAGRKLVATGQFAAAQLHYEKALQFECRVEELFRALIEVLGRRGRSAAATIAYNSCAVAMRRYHGRLPAPETRAAWEAAVVPTAPLREDSNILSPPGAPVAVPAPAAPQSSQPAYA
jgi:DNA-binding SARP family transcriptional activator